ncbi:MAG TPA: YraN family protein [Mycobacteriales bacterium]|jgi:putative endonuclease|nr:YraN family protein [Mycobacteriales bacterium]
MHTKDQLGIAGEDYAVRYLVGAGFTIVTRNWRCPEGEVDILAMDGNTLVVVEVKTRTSTAYGLPLEAVTWRKSEKLKTLAMCWLRERPHRGPIRFDVISIVMPKNARPELQHVRAAF